MWCPLAAGLRSTEGPVQKCRQLLPGKPWPTWWVWPVPSTSLHLCHMKCCSRFTSSTWHSALVDSGSTGRELPQRSSQSGGAPGELQFGLTQYCQPCGPSPGSPVCGSGGLSSHKADTLDRHRNSSRSQRAEVPLPHHALQRAPATHSVATS